MLIQQGVVRSADADRRLALLLALVAGALNAAGFYAAGLYSANMTGNVSTISDNIGTGQISLAGFYAGLVATFIVGATISALLINAGKRHRFAGIYALSITTEAILLATLGWVDLSVQGAARGAVLTFGLSFLMGLQNAVVTQISNARVRTTHVTGMLTDIGIELGNLLELWLRPCHDGEVALNRDKLRLHWQTVAAFLVGGVVGVATYRLSGNALLFGCSALLLTASVQHVWKPGGRAL